MNDYILFMFNDVADEKAAHDSALWEQYITGLHATGQFDGGSAIGKGLRVKKDCAEQPAPTGCIGYIRVHAESMDGARRFLEGNPTFEAGGTVEVRELVRS